MQDFQRTPVMIKYKQFTATRNGAIMFKKMCLNIKGENTYFTNNELFNVSFQSNIRQIRHHMWYNLHNKQTNEQIRIPIQRKIELLLVTFHKLLGYMYKDGMKEK